ncbi:hypothetical protein ABT255_52735 [Streptomyces mirabilis]|uniref:hypothetical protein n=1 Tax=Streptomyces mirabilis TaxID=68239 RepID=UPI0033166BBF
MSTPSGQMQHSSTATYSHAIQVLESAKTQMTAIRGQVEEAKATLSAHYGGPDGQAYAQVMETWCQEVDRIMNTCEAMQNQLGNSMQSNNKVQSGNLQAVYNQGRLTPFGSQVESGAYTAMMS